MQTPNQIHLSSSSLLAETGVGNRMFLLPETAIRARELTTLGGGAAVRWRSIARAGIPSSKIGKVVREIKNWAPIDLLRVWGIEIAILCRSLLTQDALPFDIPKFILFSSRNILTSLFSPIDSQSGQFARSIVAIL